MTTKHFPIVFILIASLAVSLSAQNGTGKTFTKSFNTDDKGTLRLDLPGEIDMKVWDNPSIRFEISVNLASGNGFMLQELANIGRYNLISKTESDVLVITAPNLQKQLRVKGEVLKETIVFSVFVPKNLQVELMPDTNALAEAKK